MRVDCVNIYLEIILRVLVTIIRLSLAKMILIPVVTCDGRVAKRSFLSSILI